MDVLEYVRFDNETLTAQFYAKVSEEIAAGNITRQAARKIFEEWNKGMEGYTYLDF